MTDDRPERVEGLPGAELITKGLSDLNKSSLSIEALLILIGGPRLRRLGIDVPNPRAENGPFEHQLYAMLEDLYGTDAHSQYNSLLRRLCSYSSALEAERGRARRLKA